MMNYLFFASLVFIWQGVASTSAPFQEVRPNDCINSATPKFTSALYSASVDVAGHHISGLLFLKSMPDSSKRAVFSNEAGITYFDFEWNKHGQFRTYHVTKKLRRKIVLNTLRKDFELVMMPEPILGAIRNGDTSHEFLAMRKKEKLIIKTSIDCQAISSVDVMGKKRKLVNASFFPEGKNIPDSVSVVHYNFNLKIGLKRLAQ